MATCNDCGKTAPKLSDSGFCEVCEAIRLEEVAQEKRVFDAEWVLEPVQDHDLETTALWCTHCKCDEQIWFEGKPTTMCQGCCDEMQVRTRRAECDM